MPPQTRLNTGAIQRKYVGPNPEPDSRWDLTITKAVNVDALDLEYSYQEEYLGWAWEKEQEARQKWDRERPAKKKWKNPNRDGKPMNDPYRLPRGWIDIEPDLDNEDLEGHIVRCQERIEEGIMPYIFENRLKHLEEVKRETLEIKAKESPALTFPVVMRLQTLQRMLDFFNQEGDKYNQAVNIKAVMHAYRHEGLQLTGLVTYWVRGKHLCLPRPFDWDEFEAIYKKCNDQSFWVEGIDGPQPHGIQAHIETPPNPRNGWGNTYTVLFRQPGSEIIAELEVLYDTGASVTAIFQEDLRDMAHVPGLSLPVMGAAAISTRLGDEVYPLVDLHCTVLSHKRKRMTQWCQVRVAVMPGRQRARDPIMRVDGPWIRQLIYMATAPDNKRRLHMATSKWELAVPSTTDLNKAVPVGLRGVSTHATGMVYLPMGLPNPPDTPIPMPSGAWNVDG